MIQHFLRDLMHIGKVLFEVTREGVLPTAIGTRVGFTRSRQMDFIVMPAGRAVVLESFGADQALDHVVGCSG